MAEDRVVNLVILGSGSAGLTAAVYAARANLNPIVVEGREPGGQLYTTTLVENFPGFPEGINGPELIDNMKEQAKRFGASFIHGEVTSVDFSYHPFICRLEDGSMLRCEALIIATGASTRKLGLESEKKLMGYGVSTCATCDGPFFRNKEVVVVGGGDSAMEEALFITKFAQKVYVIHRRDKLRASKILQERTFNNEKIEFLWNSELKEIYGDREKGVTGVKLLNNKTHESWLKPCDGVFLAIGHDPNTSIFKGQLEMDEKGYIIQKGEAKTSVEGVFVAGDVHDYRYRQAVTAAGSGCKAALEAEKFLEGII